MSAKLIPQAVRPQPNGAFERLMSWGQHLPGKVGYVCHRKLKRRYCRRSADTFSHVLADTGTGDLCIDLGANIGEVTQQLAATGAEVIAFEPDPEVFKALQENTKALNNVSLQQKAAGAKSERLLLRRTTRWDPANPTEHTGASSIVRMDAGMSDATAVEVDVVDFPAWLATLDRDVRVLKMDIEGAEWDLMEALLDHPVLERIDCIFVETHERVDPQINIPRFTRLVDQAVALQRPYINLYWV